MKLLTMKLKLIDFVIVKISYVVLEILPLEVNIVV